MLAEIQQFVNWVRRRNPQARTWKDYSYDLSLFAQLVGDVLPTEITFREVDRFVNVMVNKGFAPTTINRRLATLVSFYDFLADDDPLLISPVFSGRHRVRQRQLLPRPVQEEALQNFFLTIENTPPPNGYADNRVRDKAMFLLMLRCGLRIGEVATLRMNDLYLNEFYPRIILRGKGGRDRSVFVSPQAEQALRSYLLERPRSGCDTVFLSYQLQGLSTTAIHKRLMRYREKAKVSFSAHQLRHSFANHLLDADVPVTTIQKLLGHRWLETTQGYVQANDHQVAEDYYAACAKMEDW